MNVIRDPLAETGTPRERRPAFSVVIPTCHRNDALAQCLERLAPGRQAGVDPDDYEVVVTDDGRRGTAEEMVRQRFPWVRWVAGPRKGPAANRNNGARHARGAFLAFTDDDCLPEPGWLAAYAAAVRDGVDVYEGKTVSPGRRYSLMEVAPENTTGGWLWSCNILVRREAFEALGGFDEEYPYAYMEDVDFRERVRERTREIPFVEGAVITHPPRIMRWTENLGPTHECDVAFWYKFGNRGQFGPRLIRYIAVSRVKGALAAKTRGERQLLPYVALSVREIGYVVRHVWGWERKWRERCRDVPPRKVPVRPW